MRKMRKLEDSFTKLLGEDSAIADLRRHPVLWPDFINIYTTLVDDPALFNAVGLGALPHFRFAFTPLFVLEFLSRNMREDSVLPRLNEQQAQSGYIILRACYLDLLDSLDNEFLQDALNVFIQNKEIFDLAVSKYDTSDDPKYFLDRYRKLRDDKTNTILEQVLKNVSKAADVRKHNAAVDAPIRALATFLCFAQAGHAQNDLGLMAQHLLSVIATDETLPEQVEVQGHRDQFIAKLEKLKTQLDEPQGLFSRKKIINGKKTAVDKAIADLKKVGDDTVAIESVIAHLEKSDIMLDNTFGGFVKSDGAKLLEDYEPRLRKNT